MRFKDSHEKAEWPIQTIEHFTQSSETTLGGRPHVVLVPGSLKLLIFFQEGRRHRFVTLTDVLWKGNKDKDGECRAAGVSQMIQAI